MAYVFLSLAILFFAVTMKILRIGPRTINVASDARQALSVIGSTEMSEEQKEKVVKESALRAAGSFFSILLRIIVTLSIPIAFVALGHMVGLYPPEDIWRALGDPFYIGGSTIFMIGFLVVFK